MFRCPNIVTNQLKTIIHNNNVRCITTTVSVLRSYYDILGIHKNCTQAQVKEAYFKLSKIYHPDLNDSVEAVEKFRDITDAYDVLKNVQLRKLYDKGQLHAAGQQYAASNHEDYTAWNPKDSRGHFYQQQQRQKKREPPRGRTEHYDYDEWERAHYGDMFRRKQRAKQRWENAPFERSAEKSRRDDMNRMMYVMITFMGLFYMLNVYLNIDRYDKPRPVKNSSNDER